MANVEFEVAATDTAPQQTRAQRLKFQLEMGLMMHMAGRDEAAKQMLTEAFETIDALIGDGH